MAFKDEFGNLGQRFDEFAARLEERTRSRPGKGAGNGGLDLRSILGTLRDLFTRDVTREGLRNLVKRDPRDILRFYTHEIDFESLRPLPWYKRYPGMAWTVFVATAYRLSPARRIAFAVAILAFFIGGIQLLFLSIQIKNQGTGAGWWLLTIVILALLLLMELRDKLDLKVDLEIAREIQFGLVPSQPFKRDATAIHGFMRPANTVGGDYFDIIVLNDRQVGVVVGDVAGKGMPAALLMALLQGSLRTLITAGFRGPDLIAKLNEYLCASLPSNSLVLMDSVLRFCGDVRQADDMTLLLIERG